MATKTQPQPMSLLVPLTVLAVIAGVALHVFELPGVAVAWLIVIVAAFAEPAPLLTGKKGPDGQPTPLGGGEEKMLARWRFASALRWQLIVPVQGLNPTVRVASSFLAALGAALVVVSLPLMGFLPGWAHAVGGYAAFALVATPMAVKRLSHPSQPCPGVGVADALAAAKGEAPLRGGLAAGCTASVLAGAAAWWVVRPFFGNLPAVATGVGVALLLVALVSYLVGRDVALTHWRTVVAARAEWTPRWERLPKLPAIPYLVDRTLVGPYTVDVFEAVNGWTTMVDQGTERQLQAVLPPGTAVHMLAHEGVDIDGNPTPGDPHPNLFRVVTYNPSEQPSLMDPDIDEDVAALRMQLAVVPASMAYNSQSPRLTSCVRVSSNPNVWVGVYAETMYTFKISSTLDTATGMDALTRSAVQTPSVTDATSGTGQSLLIVGDWASGEPEFDEEACAPFINRSIGANSMAEFIEYTVEANAWQGRWRTAKAKHIPHPQMQLKQSQRVNTSTVGQVQVHCLPHIVPGGAPPDEFWKFAPGLAATVPGGAKLSVVTPFTQPGSGGGTRHEAAFNYVWSTDPVPSNPAMIAPGNTDGAKLVLSALVSIAFDKAKLPRPEVLRARCLTSGSEQAHAWELHLRLYGLLPTQLRSAAGKLASHLGCEWVRVVPGDGDKAKLYLGASPLGKSLSRTSDGPLLASLDWGQAWVNTKLTSDDGRTPVLEHTGQVETNPDISVLDFRLVPGGPDVARIKANVSKLKAETNNAFIQVAQGPGGPQTVRVMCSREDPLPEMAPFDADLVDEYAARDELPFAVGVTGQTVALRPKDVHLAVFGMTGGGKSVLLQSLLYGACVARWDVFIGDPTKGGADFQFARPYTRILAQSLAGTQQMMKTVYDEVVRRKNLNAEHGVGSINGLPDEVRPPRMLVMLDEFTSLVIPDAVPKASDDPDADFEREQVIASNAQRASIGMLTSRIAREARSAGVVLVLATQKLTATILDSVPGSNDLKANLSRLLLGKHSYGDKQAAFRQPDEAPLMGDLIPPGRGIFETVSASPDIIQSWYAVGEQETLSRELASRLEPLPTDLVIDVDGAAAAQPATAPDTGPVALPVQEHTELDLSALVLDDVEPEEDVQVPLSPAVPEPAVPGGDGLDAFDPWAVHDVDEAADGEGVPVAEPALVVADPWPVQEQAESDAAGELVAGGGDEVDPWGVIDSEAPQEAPSVPVTIVEDDKPSPENLDDLFNDF